MVRSRRHRAAALGCFAALAMTGLEAVSFHRHCEEHSDEATQSNRLVGSVDVFDVAGVQSAARCVVAVARFGYDLYLCGTAGLDCRFQVKACATNSKSAVVD